MDAEFIQVRLRRTTADRIREFSRRVLKAVEAGRVDAPLHPHLGITVDIAVNVLLDRVERDIARKARSNTKKQPK